MKKFLKKQQVEKMFENDMSIINSRLNNLNPEQVEMFYWSQFLSSLYKNKGISKRQYNEWSYEKICN